MVIESTTPDPEAETQDPINNRQSTITNQSRINNL
jgi:hypothetical protein